METLHKSSGKLRYSQGNAGHRLIVEVDEQISLYYRSLLPKWIYTNKQMYPAHISVVRKEIPPKLEFWGKYEGQEVEFHYTNIIYNGEIYYWLNVFSTQLEEIRVELGLEVSSIYTRPPDGFDRVFHCTIGNIKMTSCF